MSTPPPLPPANPNRPDEARASSTPVKRGWRRLPLWVWLVIFVLVGGTVAAIGVGAVALGRLFGEGINTFEEDARVALQRNPTIRTHIGTIREFELDFTATGNSVHPNDFVFDLEGDRGEGTVRARLESTLDGERVEKGVLRTKNGAEWPLTPDHEMADDDFYGVE